MTTYYTKEHEWITVEGETGTIGITEYAVTQLGDVVFVDLPEIGATFSSGDDMAVVESVKAASDVYAPVSGEVVEINAALSDTPEKVNEGPTGDGWFCKIKLSAPGELEQLMDLDAYKAHCGDS